jgi:hypothetical protein
MSHRKTCGVFVLVMLAGTVVQGAFAASLATVGVEMNAGRLGLTPGNGGRY